MIRPVRRIPILFAALCPLLGLAGALALVAIAGDDRPARMTGYALGALPLGVAMGAFGGWSWVWAGRSRAGLNLMAWIGGFGALVAGLIVAQVLAAIRFRQTGATGLLSLAALPYTEEFLMVVPLVPALAALGAGTARHHAGRGAAVALAWSMGLAAGAVALAGPGLILVSLLGRTGILNPIVLAVVGLMAVWWLDRRVA